MSQQLLWRRSMKGRVILTVDGLGTMHSRSEKVLNTGVLELLPRALTYLRRMAYMLLNGAFVVWLSQVASVLALGLKTHMEPLFDPLVCLQP